MCKINQEKKQSCNDFYFNHKCNNNYCSKGVKTCFQFNLIKSVIENKNFQIQNNINSKHYNDLIGKIKSCSLNQIQFKPKNACHKTYNNCFIKIPFENIKMPVECPCKKPFKENCIANYCTKDANSCIELKYHLSASANNKASNVNFQKCPFGQLSQWVNL